MPIRSVVINVTDIARSIDFYTRFLGVETVVSDDDHAVLDAVTATLRLRRVEAGGRGEISTFVADDLQAGFRHVGFKVSDLDERVAWLQAAGVPFHLEPIHAEGDVRLTFFTDPDGTLLEFVEGPLQYHEVYDRDAVDADWALGDPDRPRFDHVAITVADLDATKAYFAQFGYLLMSGIHQPSDARGFEINFLRDGDSSLEVFTFEHAEKSRREPQLNAPGFAAVEFVGSRPSDAVLIGTVNDVEHLTDVDGLVHFVTSA